MRVGGGLPPAGIYGPRRNRRHMPNKTFWARLTVLCYVYCVVYEVILVPSAMDAWIVWYQWRWTSFLALFIAAVGLVGYISAAGREAREKAAKDPAKTP